MVNLNKVLIAGNLTDNPKEKVTDSGTTISNFTLAVNDNYNDDAQFISCVAFSKTAELINKYMSKGSGMLVEGKIQNRSWEDKNGERKYKTEVLVNSVSFGSKKDNEQEGNIKDDFEEEFDDEDLEDIPF